MFTLHSIVLIVHMLISAAMIGLILLQRGKGAEAGAAFGAGASGTVFGAKGSANFLSRSTAALATLFFATSLSLAYLGSEAPPSESLMDEVTEQGETLPSVMPLEPGEVVEAGDEVPDLPAVQQPDAPPATSEPQNDGQGSEP